MAGKEESVKAIIYNADAFAALLENTSALETVINNDAGRTVIINAIEYYTNASNVIQAVKDDLDSIKNNMPLIGESSVEKIDKCIDVINSTVQVLDKTASYSDIIINNINAMLDNIEAMGVLFQSNAAVSAILENPDIRTLIASKIQSGDKDFITLLYSSSLVINYMLTHADTLYSDPENYQARRSARIQGVVYITDYTGTFYGDHGFGAQNWYDLNGTYQTGFYNAKKVNVFGYDFMATGSSYSGSTSAAKGFYVYGFKF